MLNTELQASFDYDCWIPMAQGFRMLHIAKHLAQSRMHLENSL